MCPVLPQVFTDIILSEEMLDDTNILTDDWTVTNGDETSNEDEPYYSHDQSCIWVSLYQFQPTPECCESVSKCYLCFKTKFVETTSFEMSVYIYPCLNPDHKAFMISTWFMKKEIVKTLNQVCWLDLATNQKKHLNSQECYMTQHSKKKPFYAEFH